MNKQEVTVVKPSLALVPVTPKSVSADEDQQLKARSSELVRGVLMDAEPQLIDSLSNLGVKAQRESAQKVQLFRSRLGTQLAHMSTGQDDKLTGGLTQLRLKLDKINPNAPASRLVRLPWIGWWFETKPADLLRKIAANYGTVGTEVNTIVNNLRAGQDELVEDNLSLQELEGDIQQQQASIQRNIYLGELLLMELEQQRQQAVEDQELSGRLQAVTAAVTLRLADLKMMEQANLQFLASIRMTHENNHQLGQTVERTVTLVTTLIDVGLAIRLALEKQRQVLEATRATQQYAGDLLAANAAAVRQQTTEIADIYQQPVVALDKLRAAHTDLMAAIEASNAAKQQGLTTLQATITEVSTMSQQLQQKMEGLPAAKATTVVSLEA